MRIESWLPGKTAWFSPSATGLGRAGRAGRRSAAALVLAVLDNRLGTGRSDDGCQSVVTAHTVMKTTRTARISVVIPAYNAAPYLAATLNSVFEQTLRPAEVIVVDDGSTDDTVAIARGFDVRVISLSNRRAAAARNAGTYAASGEYIAYMDADDLWLPDKLAVQVSALESQTGAAFSFTDYRAFDERGVHEKSSGLLHHPAFRRVASIVGKKTKCGDIVIADDGNRPVLPDCYILPSSLLVRREDVLAIGAFDETVLVSEDFEFLLRLFKRVPAVAVMQSLLLYRRHAAQQTANQTTFKLSVFDIAKRVASAPERYPSGDARHMAKTGYLRFYRLGIEQARRQQFEDATRSFEQSLAERWTVSAKLAVIGSRACTSTAGRRAFGLARTLWKQRPGHGKK